MELSSGSQPFTAMTDSARNPSTAKLPLYLGPWEHEQKKCVFFADLCSSKKCAEMPFLKHFCFHHGRWHSRPAHVMATYFLLATCVLWPRALNALIRPVCVGCGKTADASPGYAGRGPLSEEAWRCRNCWVDLYANGLEVASRRGASVFALGPSHFERKALIAASFPWKEVDDGNILEVQAGNGQKQHLLGVASLPVYNQITLNLLRRAYAAYDQVVWCVSNWFFGNKDIEKLRSLGKKTSEEELFLWSDFYAGNVERSLITSENTDLLVHHSTRCIDFILSEMPRTKLLFWCLAKRTFNKHGQSKQIPLHGQYEALISRYQSHSLDVLDYHAKDTFDRTCCQDRSGHPTLLGYQTISQLLNEASAG